MLDKSYWRDYSRFVMTVSPLQRVRESQHLSRARLAGLADVTSQTIYNLERGSVPGLETARKVAEALGVTVDEVFPVQQSEVA